jgi:hypothetical protein
LHGFAGIVFIAQHAYGGREQSRPEFAHHAFVGFAVASFELQDQSTIAEISFGLNSLDLVRTGGQIRRYAGWEVIGGRST